MVKHSVQTVHDPKQSSIRVQVYECPKCHKLSAEVIGGVASDPPDEAAQFSLSERPVDDPQTPGDFGLRTLIQLLHGPDL